MARRSHPLVSPRRRTVIVFACACILFGVALGVASIPLGTTNGAEANEDAATASDTLTASGAVIEAPDPPRSTTVASTPVATLDAAPPGEVTIVGDSLSLSAEPHLDESTYPRFSVDAVVGRQFSTGVDVIADLRDRGELADTVVVALGTNGPIDPVDAAEMAFLLSDRRAVYIVNVRVPRPWKGEVNLALATMAERMDNATVVDWYDLTFDPETADDWLAGDGYHLSVRGTQAFADVVLWTVLHPGQS